MTILQTIIRDFEKSLLTEGYDAPILIRFTKENCVKLREESLGVIRSTNPLPSDVFRFHNIIIEAPPGFIWR